MGALSQLSGDRVYLDANVLVYAFEDYPQLHDRVEHLFARMDRGELQSVTSELSLAEMLVKPIRDGNARAQNCYEQLFSSSSRLLVVPVERAVLVEAARIRARSSLKLPDAIHAATGRLAGCTTFLTNDQRFTALADLPVMMVGDLPV